MKINRNNYETFFLDYHEGNLNEELKKELSLFLESNPDLKKEFENFEWMTVPAPETTFFNKGQLKKQTVTLLNYKSFFVAYAEGDINAIEKSEVESFLWQNPSLKPELEIFKQLKLVPDHKIVFENKKQLKQGAKIIAFTSSIYRVAIAASIALFIISYFLFLNKKEQTTAHLETPKKAIENTLPAPSENNTEVIVNRKKENKKEAKQNNTPKTIVHPVKNQEPSMVTNQIPISENKSNEELLAGRDENKISIPELENHNTVQNNLSENSLAQNNSTIQKPFKATASELSTVFNDDDLKELGVSRNNQQKTKNTLWDLASKGAHEISKATGAEIAMNKQNNELENTDSYAFAIGNFSISHTTNK